MRKQLTRRNGVLRPILSVLLRQMFHPMVRLLLLLKLLLLFRGGETPKKWIHKSNISEFSIFIKIPKIWGSKGYQGATFYRGDFLFDHLLIFYAPFKG